MTKFRIRGEEWDLEVNGKDVHPFLAWLNVLTLALLALEDPKVDEVLKAGNVVIENGDGVQLFPPPRPAIERRSPGEKDN